MIIRLLCVVILEAAQNVVDTFFDFSIRILVGLIHCDLAYSFVKLKNKKCKAGDESS